MNDAFEKALPGKTQKAAFDQAIDEIGIPLYSSFDSFRTVKNRKIKNRNKSR